MQDNTILLVEDNADDEALALRALRHSEFVKEVVVVRDGAEALDYLFGNGQYADRDTRPAAAPYPAGHEAAQTEWSGCAPSYPPGRTYPISPCCSDDVFPSGNRHHCRLQSWSQQLCTEASEF
jgi:hypothetical protein